MSDKPLTDKLAGIFDHSLDMRIPDEKNPRKITKDRSWEKVTSSQTLSDKDAHNEQGSLRPSRAANETIQNSVGMKPTGNTLFNPNGAQNVKESPLTKVLIEDAKQRREDRKPERDNSWETVNPAKKTDDVYAGSMGFTPNRSSFSPAPMPKVDIPEIAQQKKKTLESQQAGIKAANMKKELDAVMADSTRSKMEGKWDWQDEAEEKINTAMAKPVAIPKVDKLASDFMKPTPYENKNPFAGLFKTPEFDDTNIKRDADIKSDRKTRKDDRSWEKVSPSKKF